MSSINAVKTKMVRKDIIKICSLQKGDVLVPGARQSQNDVAKTSNFILIPLAMITLSQHKHQQRIYAFNVSVHSFVISLRNQYQYVVIHLPVSILLIFSTESSNFSQFLMEHNSAAGWLLLKSPLVAFILLLKHAKHLYINVELYYS